MIVALLGSGTMGAPIARHLKAAGYDVRVFNRTAERLEPLVRSGCVPCVTPAVAAAGADLILSCVSDDDASRDVWFGEHGAARACAGEAVAIELSTLSVAYIDQWHAGFRAGGTVALDAPLTGGRRGAEASQLTAFVGAEAEHARRVASVLRCFCRHQLNVGGPGAGTRFKLVYNMVSAAILASFAEGLNVLEALELDTDMAVETFASTGWGSAVAHSKGAAMRDGRYEPAAFKAGLMRKDLDYYVQAAGNAGASAPIGNLVRDMYRALVESGAGDLDFAAIRTIGVAPDRDRR